VNFEGHKGAPSLGENLKKKGKAGKIQLLNKNIRGVSGIVVGLEIYIQQMGRIQLPFPLLRLVGIIPEIPFLEFDPVFYPGIQVKGIKKTRETAIGVVKAVITDTMRVHGIASQF
jgi:hypothetical protein